MREQIYLFVCIFGGVGFIAYVLSALLLRGEGRKLRQRLSTGPATERKPSRVGLRPTLEHLGQMAARPFLPKTREKQSTLRRSLGYAGKYDPSAVKFVTGAKVILLAMGIIGGYVVGTWLNQVFLGLSVGGLVGYLLPVLWLRIRIKQNQKALEYALPDALDLMVVCVEAGLTIDAAIQRVGQEMGLAHPQLSREFGMTHMETRVGLARTEALRNLALRTGSNSLAGLTSMLIQADRFGTSIAQGLRIHAESLRLSRQFAAEEQAAKSSVKLSFPLVLFIFPATFIVLAGPTIIGLMHSALFQ